MTDLAKITSIFQSLIKRDISLNEDYLKITKVCFKNVKKLETLKHQVVLQKEELEKLSNTKDELIKVIDKKKSIECEDAQMVSLNEQLKTLLDEYNLLESDTLSKLVEAIESDHASAYKKRMYLKLLKFCTKVFIDGNTPSSMIRGFAANDFEKALFPFEFHTRLMTEKEIVNEMWELSKQTSSNINDWEKLFQI